MNAITMALLVTLVSTTAQARDTFVQGHVRQDGTYVQPHYRSSPDSSTLNNYSTKGNTNLYTGKNGTVDPYTAPHNYNGLNDTPVRHAPVKMYGY